MIVETAEEREARGHPLGEATPYAAMGGLTGFSSLAEGNMRLDPSGRGKKKIKQNDTFNSYTANKMDYFLFFFYYCK